MNVRSHVLSAPVWDHQVHQPVLKSGCIWFLSSMDGSPTRRGSLCGAASVPFTRKNPGWNHASLAGNWYWAGPQSMHYLACTTWRNMKYSQNLGNKQFLPSVILKLIPLLKLNYEQIDAPNTGCMVQSLQRHDPVFCSTITWTRESLKQQRTFTMMSLARNSS